MTGNLLKICSSEHFLCQWQDFSQNNNKFKAFKMFDENKQM